MAAVVWADVVALQSSLSTVSVGAQMIILAHVNEDLEPGAFGGEDSARYHLARCYLAAHFGEMSRRNGTQDVRSETIGVASMTLAYADGDEESLSQTSWGRQFSLMLNASPIRFVWGSSL